MLYWSTKRPDEEKQVGNELCGVYKTETMDMGIHGRKGRGGCREDLLLCGTFGNFSHTRFRGLQYADAENRSSDPGGRTGWLAHGINS